LVVVGSISNGQVSVYGGTLDGSGSIAGDVEVYTGGTLAAGTLGTIGALTINNTLELSGTAALRISKTGGVLTSDNVQSTGGITYGGTLAVANVTSDLHALTNGDAFTLFTTTAYGGAFTATNLPALPYGMVWDWNPATGVLSVVAGTSVNLDPTTAHFQAVSASGSMTFTWAADHQGWQLYTNAVGLDATGSWFPVAGSASTTTETININPANPSVFFQLRYP